MGTNVGVVIGLGEGDGDGGVGTGGTGITTGAGTGATGDGDGTVAMGPKGGLVSPVGDVADCIPTTPPKICTTPLLARTSGIIIGAPPTVTFPDDGSIATGNEALLAASTLRKATREDAWIPPDGIMWLSTSV